MSNHLFDQRKIQETIDTLNGYGDPDSKAMAHDMRIVVDALEQGFAENGGVWHNNAVEYLGESIADFMVQLILRTVVVQGPQIAGVLLQNLFQSSFVAGHIVGEGSEHIVKCTCAATETITI